MVVLYVIHDKRKNICYKCNGSQICIHKKKFSVPQLPDGNICVHNKHKDIVKSV